MRWEEQAEVRRVRTGGDASNKSAHCVYWSPAVRARALACGPCSLARRESGKQARR